MYAVKVTKPIGIKVRISPTISVTRIIAVKGAFEMALK